MFHVKDAQIRNVVAEHHPIPSNASKARIHAFAEEVARRLSFAVGAPLEPTVAYLGGRIEYKNPLSTGTEIPESIRIWSSKDFTIFLPTMTSPERDRFTIAHELGHFFIHYPLVAQAHPGEVMVATRWVDESDPAQQRAEWEANWFAAAFLMPAQPFKEMLLRTNLSTVAARFGVSSAAADIRARTLG